MYPYWGNSACIAKLSCDGGYKYFLKFLNWSFTLFGSKVSSFLPYSICYYIELGFLDNIFAFLFLYTIFLFFLFLIINI